MTDDEFRPLDLPLGWAKSPNSDLRHWLTKTTETVYYDYVGELGNRQKHFTDILEDEDIEITDKRKQRAEIIKQNPLFMEESPDTKELSANAESVKQRYAVGQLLIAGDNRYLSDDLIKSFQCFDQHAAWFPSHPVLPVLRYAAQRGYNDQQGA